MPTDYRLRLKMPAEEIDKGHPSRLLFTRSGLLVTTGFQRVVIGGRGPYVEFIDDQVVEEALMWVRTGAYYIEYRTTDVWYVKAYKQVWPVDYADYRRDLWYISPFDLFRENRESLIDPLPKGHRA